MQHVKNKYDSIQKSLTFKSTPLDDKLLFNP